MKLDKQHLALFTRHIKWIFRPLKSAHEIPTFIFLWLHNALTPSIPITLESLGNSETLTSSEIVDKNKCILKWLYMLILIKGHIDFIEAIVDYSVLYKVKGVGGR